MHFWSECPKTMNSLSVFLCATFRDLLDERSKVLDAIRVLKLRHGSMEFFGAQPGAPLETCLAEVAQSDVVVVIVGHRYGALAPGLGISFSEAEYREAHRLEKPCLVYIRSDDVPVLPAYVETDTEKRRLLDDWKKTLAARHTAVSYTSAERLSVQVAADLGRTAQAIQTSTEQKDATQTNDLSPELHREIRGLIDKAVEAGVPERTVLGAVRRVLMDLPASSTLRGGRILLSFASSDQEVARRIAPGLQALGADVVLDEAPVDERRSVIGRLTAAIEAADYVVFLLSQSSAHSRWAREELNAAVWRQVAGPGGPAIFPVLIDDVEVPTLLRTVLTVDIRDHDFGAGIQRIVAAIERHRLEHLHNEPRVAGDYSLTGTFRRK